MSSVKTLLVLSHPHHDTPDVHEGVKLGLRLVEDPAVELRVYLMGDSVWCAVRSAPAAGDPGPSRPLAALTERGILVGACLPCLAERDIAMDQLLPGVHLTSTSELAEWTLWADKVLSWAHAAD